MLLLIEGLAMCLIILTVCVVGISFDGPVGLVTFYEPEVQERVVAMGLITKEKIRRNAAIAGIAVLTPLALLIPCLVYGFNGAVGFREGWFQMVVISMIYNLFDRLFIDWFWVGKTNAWHIEGTDDLKPYIPRRTLIKKWVSTLTVTPLFYALVAWVMTFFIR